MPEPSASNFSAALDDDTSLMGDLTNLKQLTLDANIDNVTGTISVAESIVGINVPCYLLVGSELIYPTATGSGDFTSSVRGAGGTTAASHLSGDAVYVVYAANYNNQLKRAIIATQKYAIDKLAPITTGGTSTAFTITTAEASALTVGETWRIIFNVTAGATPTLNRDGKGAKNLKYYDSTGTKQSCGATTIYANVPYVVYYDGTDYVLIGPLLSHFKKRVVTVTQSATPSINTDSGDIFVITGLAQDITSLTSGLTGSPNQGDMMLIEVTDDGTSRNITPGASFAGTTNNTLTGLATTISKKEMLLWKYSSALSKWELVARDHSA